MAIFHYNIAAIILLIVIIISIKNKNIKLKQNKIFFLILLSSIVSTACSLSTSLLINFIKSENILKFIQTGFIFSFNLTYILYFYYLLNLDKSNKNLFYKIFLLIMLILNIILCFIGFNNDNIIKIDILGKVINGLGIYSLYFLTIISCILMALFIIVKRKTIKLKHKIVYFSYILITVSAICLEIYFEKILKENLNILSFSNSICLLIIYMSLQNPNSFIDSQSKAINQLTLFDELDVICKSKNIVTTFYFDSLKLVMEKSGFNVYQTIQRNITDYLKKHFSKVVYYINDNQYIIISKKNLNLSKIKNEGIEIQEFELNATPIIHEYKAGRDFKNKEEAIKLFFNPLNKKKDKEAINLARTIKVEEELRKAIKEKSFIVYFQPIFSIRDNRYKKAEVLVRMKDNVAYPDEFIPLAENLGLINQVDEIIMEKAFKYIKEYNLDKVLKNIDINLSPVECLNKSLAKRVIKLLDKYDINPSFLNLEMLETKEILESDIFKNNIDILRKKGVMFSLDDFGTGYSNIINMTNYPYHTIKIDKSILYNAFNSSNSMRLFTKLTDLIFSLGYDIILEGVETEEQLMLAKRLNINYIQGYYFSKPLNMEDFLKVVK